MTVIVRQSALDDVDVLCDLLLGDAEVRQGQDPVLWALEASARDRIVQSLTTAMAGEDVAFRQKWLLAENRGEGVGAAHSILLPVPPIYAGAFGPPGLIMQQSCVTPTAPPGTRGALITAAEADLLDAGAQILLGASVTGSAFERDYIDHGYEPLTLYFAKSNLGQADLCAPVRPAVAADVPEIVTLSAVHRRILDQLHHRFWAPHAEADTRFGSWMRHSLGLSDRDMFVADGPDRLRGYAISQPATALHIPPAHLCSGIGIIDDFYHAQLENPAKLASGSDQAVNLFGAAETALAQRGNRAALVVCPAAWAAKVEMLGKAGYAKAITWFYKKPA